MLCLFFIPPAMTCRLSVWALATCTRVQVQGKVANIWRKHFCGLPLLTFSFPSTYLPALVYSSQLVLLFWCVVLNLLIFYPKCIFVISGKVGLWSLIVLCRKVEHWEIFFLISYVWALLLLSYLSIVM
jgi:hypothetical protein